MQNLTEWDYRRFVYDDPMRIDLDIQRLVKRVPVHNLLWDIKNGVKAGEWHTITSETDIEHYLDAVKPRLFSRWLYIARRQTKEYAKNHREIKRTAQHPESSGVSALLRVRRCLR